MSKGGKHRKVNPYGAIVTSDEQFETVIKEAEQKKKPKQKRKQKAMQEEESETDETVKLHLESGTNEDFSDEEPIFPEHFLFPPVTERQSYLHLKFVWSEIYPPVAENQLVRKFFAGIYYSDTRGKKARLYVGKVMQRCLHESDGPTISLTLSCLKPGIGFATMLDESSSHLQPDIDDFKAFNLIARPLEATEEKGKK